MIFLPSSQHRRMPWKNGLGETTEIAVYPPHASLTHFDWRISMARVTASAPFSLFPDIDRTLTVLEGGGLSLSIDGGAPVRLDTASPPFSFAGDAVTDVLLEGDNLLDFNVMTRRGQFAQQVTRLSLDRPLTKRVDSDVVLVFCIDGELVISSAQEQVRLKKQDAMLCDATPVTLELTGSTAAELLWVSLSRLA